jgi:biotin operon repressor
MANDNPLVDRLVSVFKALADPTRLRILGALAERSMTGKALADHLSIGAPTISHHIAKLERAGLISVSREGQSHRYELNQTALRNLVLGNAQDIMPISAPNADVAADDGEARERAKVIRDFFDGPRLKQIPAQRKKRVIVLQHLAAEFDPERSYSEREVNDILTVADDDYATLRRELVDYGFMTRDHGVYRVARQLPQRSPHVAQEITGDETAWLRRLLNSPGRPERS